MLDFVTIDVTDSLEECVDETVPEIDTVTVGEVDALEDDDAEPDRVTVVVTDSLGDEVNVTDTLEEDVDETDGDVDTVAVTDGEVDALGV